ncbi:MAG: YdcF family protein [Clostridia bacterium]|nr:YdcF family protein [Clostridia bacterium]
MLITKPNMGTVLPMVLAIPVFVCAALIEYPVMQVLLGVGVIAYAVFFVFVAGVSCRLKAFAARKAKNGADVLVVLGMGLKGTKMLTTLKKRLERAKSYLDENPNTYVLLSGGMTEGALVSEASAMREYLLHNGIEQKRIIIEERSVSTEENFVFSASVIIKRFGKDAKVAFVTTNFHLMRSYMTAKNMGHDWECFGAKDEWFIAPNNYLRECAAIVQYLLKGKIKL